LFPADYPLLHPLKFLRPFPISRPAPQAWGGEWGWDGVFKALGISSIL